MTNERPSVGSWPANAISDVSSARKHLQDRGYASSDFTLVAHHKILNVLKRQVVNTALTFEDWLKNKGILYDVVMDDKQPINVAYIYATNKNFPMLQEIDGGTRFVVYGSKVKITDVRFIIGD